jgi:hypothetical protein
MATEQGSWERITAALEDTVGPGRPSGEWTRYCCPAHEADGHHKPSLGIKYDLAQQKTVVKCFTGCDNEVVLDRLGLQVRDIYDQPITRGGGYVVRRRPQPRRTVSRADRAIDAAGLPLVKPGKDVGRQTGPATVVATYAYIEPDGQVVGEVVRKHIPHAHGRTKEFYQRRWNAGTGQMEPGGFAPVPFQLPELLAAVAQGRTVYIAEGEEDVLALGRAGVAATCNAAGAGKWRAEHARWLTGARRVVVIADRDAPGYRHADKVAQSLDGLVGEVRIVQARDGKDFRDHALAGYELGELEPVPGLDHRTPITAAMPEAGVSSAGEAALDAGTAASPTPPPRTPELEEGTTDMGEISGLGMNDHTQHHDDAVDHLASKFSQIVAQLTQQLMVWVQKTADLQRQAAEEARRRGEEAARAYEAARKAECKAVETRLAKLRERGWERLTRTQVVEAVGDAALWAGDSEQAARMLGELSEHVRERFGVHIDTTTGHVTVDAPEELAGQLAKAEQVRTATERTRTAQDRMVSLVAAEKDLPEETKAKLYQAIEEWQRNPNGHTLQTLTKKLEAAGVADKTRTKVKFVAVYLGAPDALTPLEDLAVAAISPAAAVLRKLGEPLVDPADECRFRVDTLLAEYQTKLRTGIDTAGVRERLTDVISVLPAEEQDKVRELGKTIRANPAAEVKPLFPGYVDRVQLADTVRAYAALAPQMELQALKPDAMDADWFAKEVKGKAGQQQRAAGMRQKIDQAIASGKGLHDLERDQLRAILADIEAGKTVAPEMIFADDRTAAALDVERNEHIARQAAHAHGRKIEQILDNGAASPVGAVRRSKDEITNAVQANTQLAAGRMTLADFEFQASDRKLMARLQSLGVPEPVRNQVRNQLVRAVDDCATTGKTARRTVDTWAQRRELVAAGRVPAKPAFDGPERSAHMAADLRAEGLSEDSVAQRLAASSGRARPISAAVSQTIGETKAPRTTAPGTGMRRAYGQGKGRGNGGRHERGLGL